jgi:hypothetical protein
MTSDILYAWESGEGRPSVEKALALLQYGFPECSLEELAALPIGQRDTLLLQLREQTFGRMLRGYIECPRCGERLSFSAQISDLCVSAPNHSGPLVLRYGDWVVHFRLPDSHDLVAAAWCGEVAAARLEILARCLLSAQKSGAELAAADLPDEVGAALAAAMSEQDPQAEVLLSMNCAACQHVWRAAFEIVTFFWAEFAAQARTILDEVALLARAFGWREADKLIAGAKDIIRVLQDLAAK